jgi:hypothetical protein
MQNEYPVFATVLHTCSLPEKKPGWSATKWQESVEEQATSERVDAGEQLTRASDAKRERYGEKRVSTRSGTSLRLLQDE